MRGTITSLNFHKKGRNGSIQGSNGRTYPFISTSILPGNHLAVGDEVEFEAVPIANGKMGTANIRKITSGGNGSAQTVKGKKPKASHQKASETKRDSLSEDTIGALAQLYEHGDYAAYLKSGCFREVTPDRIAISQLEQALTCAKRLLCPEDTEPVVLNRFQKELLTAADCVELLKRFKPFEDHPELAEACCESMLVPPQNQRLAYKRLNRLCNCDGSNSSFTGLTRYFTACENSVLPYLFLLRAFSAIGAKGIRVCVEDYIRCIKGMSRETMMELDGADKLILLPQFIQAIHRHLLPWNQLGQALQTNLISVFLTFGQIDALKSMLDALCAAPDSMEQQIVDLLEHYDTWTLETFNAFTDPYVSRPLLHRICALIWDQQSGEACLSDAFLRLLSWVIRVDTDAIDEALRIKYSKTFTKLQKQLSLLESLPRVLVMLEHDPCMYNLAAYISLVVSNEISALQLENVSPACRDALDRWECVSQSYFERQIHGFEQTLGNPDAEFAGLCTMLRCDFSRFFQLQELYADRIISRETLEGYSEGELEQLLDRLYPQGAYAAYCKVYRYADLKGMPFKCSLRRSYVESLLQLHRFAEAVAVLSEDSQLPPEDRKELLCRAICENFSVYGITQNAFSIFSSSFSVEKATELLTGEINGTARGFAAVAALIAIHAHADDMLRAMYLYSMFQDRGECGYTKLYSHFRSRLNSVQAKTNLQTNHYNVIEIAFHALSVDDLIDFLQWAGKIKIIGFKMYQPFHVYERHFDRLLEDPMRLDTWNRFYTHLVQHSDVTAWMICVCNSVLSQKFHITDTQNIYKAVDLVLDKANEKSIPINFLDIACSYIMTSGNIHLCTKMYEQFSLEGVCNKVTNSNPWTGRRPQVLEVFNRYCIDNFKETGNPLYYKLLKLLWEKSGESDLQELSDLSVSKQFLFNKICQNYLTGTHFSEMVTLLNSDSWRDLTFIESEMLALLKMVYSDNAVLLHANPVLYKDEIEIERIKRDCVDVVKDYPKLDQETDRFRKSANSLEHKLAVFAHIFAICYTRDIYEEYYLEKIQLDNERMRMAYCAFQSKAYFAQLKYDPAFHFFYYRWRYQKLYIMEKAQFGSQADDLAIVSAMESNGHTQYVLENDYLPFKQDVDTFYAYEDIPLEARNLFLICLANGKLQYFLELYAHLIAGLGTDQKAVIKSLIARVDYREANCGLFSRYLQDICTGNMDQALTVAEAISDFALVTLQAIDKCPDRAQACAYLKTIAVESTPKSCFDHISEKMDDGQFSAYMALLVPMLCACELDLQIYRRLRQQKIRSKNPVCNDRYQHILKFLQQYDPFAQNIAAYLQALTACMEGRRDVAARIISQNDISIGIPDEWKKEAELIRKYASRTDDAPFEPDRRISDSSRFSRGQEMEFRFIKALIHVFGTQWEAISDSRITEVLEAFSSEAEHICSRIKAGLLILGNYRKLADRLRASGLPHTNLQLSFRIGMLALECADVISDDLKLLIAAELFNARNSLESEQRFALYTQFEAALKKQISFAAWCENHAIIERFVRVIQNDTGFEMLQQQVLIPGLELCKPECSLETRFEKLRELSGACYGSRSIHEERLRGAIERELHELENGPRLRVKIVNENACVTDDTVYFQIENIGSHTVFLDSPECRVVVSFGNTNAAKVISMTDISELRPESVTGGKCPAVIDEKGCSVSVSIEIGKSLICRTEEMLLAAPPPEQIRVDVTTAYDVNHAVREEKELFGREKETRMLQYMVPRGKTVIYGPSRIGKTSLLNWVRNTYAVSRENVITVLLGGEKHKLNDYRRHARKRTPLQYDDASMTEYLLVDSILAAFEEPGRLGNGRLKLTEEIKSGIRRILEDQSKCVRIRYDNVGALLKDAGLELWVLLDEFQQAVEKWTPDMGGDFIDACQWIDDESPIKLILCGSDDLLKHMVLEDNSVWPTLFPSSCRIPVGPLGDKAFGEMIRKDKSVRTAGLRYSNEAINALYMYTGGVALYGKQICNTILRDIDADSSYFANRDIVYPADIARATQCLLDRQTKEMATEVSEGILNIYKEVTKNLDKDTDMQYLYYMAQWLAKHPDAHGFPETEFTGQTLRCKKEYLLNSLRVAEERRIIRKISGETEPSVYEFRTLFYYYAFRGMASRDLDMDKIFISDLPEDAENIRYKMVTVEEIVKETQKALSEGVMNGTISREQLNNARALLGNNTWNTINNQGGSIEYYKDVGTVDKSTVNISIQSISNTLNGILMAGDDPQKLLSGIQALPRLDCYLPQPSDGEEPEISEEQLSRAIDHYAADLQEGWENARSNEAEKPIEEIAYHTVLGMSEEDYDEFMMRYDLPEYFLDSLKFAYQLDMMFDKGAVGANADVIDYSPVTIMYCKVVEGLLKEYHIKAYSKALPRIDIYININKYKWSEIDTLPHQQQQQLTIGSFVKPLTKFKWATEELSKLTKVDKQEWETHKAMINKVKNIRNPSAHGNKGHRITAAQKSNITQMLLSDGGILRLVRIVSEL